MFSKKIITDLVLDISPQIQIHIQNRFFKPIRELKSPNSMIETSCVAFIVIISFAKNSYIS